MTASPRRRRRRTQIAAIVGVVLVVAAGIVATVGVTELSTSRAGETVAFDARPVAQFPATPNAVVGVVDGDSRLTSLVVATLAPSGVGGSLVTVPVNVDANAGFGDEVVPVAARPYSVDDPTSVDELISLVEPVLAISIGSGVLLEADDVAAFVEPWAPLTVDLPEDVVDDATDGRVVVPAGEQQLASEAVANVLTSIDASGRSYDHHATDVAVWDALAGAVSAAPASAPAPSSDDADGTPRSSADDVLARLVSGPVDVRDLALSPESPTGAEVEAGTPDAVITDRRDALLVFGSISPGVVSTPNPALAFQIVASFSEDELAIVGPDATVETVVVEYIGELLFSSANVVSIVITPAVEGEPAPEVTTVSVVDGTYVEDVTEVSTIIFGDEVVVGLAGSRIDGVDVVVELGLDSLRTRRDIEAAGGRDAADLGLAAEEPVDGGDGTETTADDAEVEVVGTDAALTGPVDGEPVVTDSADATGAGSDTVATDE
ncbi:MAG: hypothetical protein AAF945_06010 [Actinomycetota bacterium]